MNISKLYAIGGFVVKVVLMDKEFDKTKNQVGLLEDKMTTAREYVAKIEEHVHFVK